MIKTLVTKLSLGSVKSDCQFRSDQSERESRWEGYVESGVEFD